MEQDELSKLVVEKFREPVKCPICGLIGELGLKKVSNESGSWSVVIRPRGVKTCYLGTLTFSEGSLADVNDRTQVVQYLQTRFKEVKAWA